MVRIMDKEERLELIKRIALIRKQIEFEDTTIEIDVEVIPPHYYDESHEESSSKRQK